MIIEDSGSLTGTITVSSNDNETSTQNINFSNLIPMSGTGVLYQSFPQSNNDTITVKNPSDTILLSMLGNTATNFSIDTDILIDTNLDGIQDNDSDNKEDVSYTDGSVFSMYNIGASNKREHKLRLALMNNGTVTESKVITIILDYIPGALEENVNLT